MKDILFYTLALGAILFLVSMVTIFISEPPKQKRIIWILRPMPVTIFAVCTVIYLMITMILYIDSKPAPKPEYKQITIPVYQKVE